jgi:(5-formylfuran-3-yl)methyl phosphate synthase
MTLLLASVGDADEAERAVALGVDVVDLRGEATPESLRAILTVVAGRRAVMAGAGSLTAVEALVDAGADYLKILTRDDTEAIAAAAALARRARLIGIMLAEDGIDRSAIRLMGETGFAGLILNTGGKRNLLDALDITALAEVADAAHEHDLMLGFAGALEPPDIPRLLLLQPDILAVRFDVAIEGVRAQIPPDQRRRTRASTKVDYRLARSAEPEARKDTLDRIFVRDFVLPLEIGTYARERGASQNVRFSIEVGIARPADVPLDMHQVLSYDVITDSIRMIGARGHVALVETLAEEIAAAVLAHPRALSVTVRVEKLDTGPGSVGVEITRERAAEAATVHPLFRTGDSDGSG